MTKNVFVVDELGNEYTPTYAKRAKGLVKTGRARWKDENTICLACPPDDMNLEDVTMNNTFSDMDKIGSVMENIEVINEVQPTDEKKNAVDGSVAAPDILALMDKIIAQGAELANVMHVIHDLPVNESPDGGQDGAARANAIRDIYVRREVTNQKMLDMLEDMLHPKKANSDVVDKVMNTSFMGVGSDTAKVMLDFIERNSRS